MKRSAALLAPLALLPLLQACANINLSQGLSLAQAAGSAAKAIIPISRDEEIQVGRAVAARVIGRYGLVDDAGLLEYVNLVGLVCAANSGRTDIPFHFAVLKGDEVNAFAAPGGFVFVTRGAIKAMASEAQLAGVLSHEIAHVSQKHILKEIQKANLVAAGSHLAEASGKIPSGVLDAVADKGANILFKGYSRSDEYESDAVGTGILYRSGYPGGGLLSFLEVLKVGAGKSGVAMLFATHPKTEDRMARVAEEIKNRKYTAAGRPDLKDRFRQRTS